MYYESVTLWGPGNKLLDKVLTKMPFTESFCQFFLGMIYKMVFFKPLMLFHTNFG